MRIVIFVFTCWLGLIANVYAQCDGARITLSTGDTVAVVCARDGVADFISFQTTSSDTGYTYLLTDDNDIIITEISGDSLDVDPLGGFRLRIWGLAYDGNKTIRPGVNINSVALSTGCNDISDNFIAIAGANLDGAFIANTRGFTRLSFCVGDGLIDPVMLANSSSSSDPYDYVLTDDQGRYIRTISGNFIDFENESPGVFLIYGINYTGSLSIQPGDSLVLGGLSTGCSELSMNNMTITLNSADAGRVYTTSGDSILNICVDGVSDLTFFTNTGTSNTNYTYIVTTPADIILVALSGDNIDFEVSGLGTYRVYGVTHQGVLNAFPMQRLSSLSTNCLGISDNYIEVNSTLPPSAGRISFSNGDTTANVCVQDGSPDLLTIVTTAVDSPYAFVVTNTRDEVLAAFVGSPATIDFDGTTPDTCRVYGLAYTGTLNTVPGRNIFTGIASGCNSISSNYLVINKVSPDGGRAFALPGTFNVEACIGNGPVWVRFGTTSASSLDYGYIVTSAANIVLGYSSGDSVDMSQYPAGDYRVWGISYWGTLDTVIGQGVDTAMHSNNCFALSSNPISIRNTSTNGGVIAGPLGRDTVQVCPMDGNPDLLRVSLGQSDTSNLDIWVITDSNLVIKSLFYHNTLAVLPVDLDSLSGFPLYLWNVNYSGNFLLSVGDTAGRNAFSTGCSDLSDNVIVLEEAFPDGGRVGASPGGFNVTVCASGPGSSVNFVNSSTASSLPYNYVVTDNNGVILTARGGPVIDFSILANLYSNDTFRIYGVSFLNSMLVLRGEQIDTARLSRGCFARSSNYVEIYVQNTDAGTLSGSGGAVTVCPGDGIVDTFGIAVTGSQTSSNYAWIITDDSDIIVDVSTSWPYDFDAQSGFPLRVWGLAYYDSLLARPGQVISQANLASGCFEYSTNFISVLAANPDGGRVFSGNGLMNLEYCLDGNPDVAVFKNTSSSTESYAYCITDPALQVISILPDSSFDFEQLPGGLYRVYGISYAGTLPVQVGRSLTSPAPGCYSFSSNFVEVEVDSSCIAEVCLMEDFMPGNSKAWAVWMKGLWGSPGYAYSFFRNTGMIIIYPDGTARIIGRIYNKADPRYQWDIDVSLFNKMDWNNWSAMGRSYATRGKHFADSNHPFWDYWELDPSGNNTFTGVQGTAFAGKQLRISHRPANLNKGFQKGQGANDKNGLHGFSGWFYFSGDYDGIGDFNNFIRCDDSDWYLGLAENALSNLDDPGADRGGKGFGETKPQRPVFNENENGGTVKMLSTTFRNKLIVECPEEGNYSIQVMDMQGRSLITMDKFFKQGKNSLDLSHLSEGAYLIRLRGQDGNTVSARILKH